MAKPAIVRMKRTFVIGLVGLGVIAFIYYFAFNSLAGVPFVPRGEVTAAFDNVDSLRVNDAVVQGGKRIGAVDEIDYRNGHAIVTMKIDDVDKRFYRDAEALVWDQSALGTKIIEIKPGTPDAGPLGDRVIPGSQTTDSADLYQVLNIFDPKTRASTAKLLREVGGGMLGRGADLQDFAASSPDLLGDLGTVSGALASPQADLTSLLRNAEQIADRFEGRERQIASLLRQTGATFEAVAVDDGRALDATVKEAPGTLRRVNAALDALEKPLRDTESAMTTLEPGAAALGVAEQDLRGIFREGRPVLGQVPGVAERAEPALEDLTPVLADARPLAPKAVNALSSAATPLRVLAPYGPDMGQLFGRLASFVSLGGAPGNRYAYINANPGLGTATTGVAESCNLAQNNYPAPGQADSDTVKGGLPPGVPCLSLDHLKRLGMPQGGNR